MKLAFSVGLSLGLMLASPVFAAGHGNGGEHGPGHGQGNTQVRLRLSLVPSNPAQTDLVTAMGTVDYRTKNNKTQFKARVQIPSPAPSLGITDSASAAAASISLEFSRAGVVYDTCTLAAGSEDDTGTSGTAFNFNLNAQDASKNKGAHFAKGSCASGIPAVQSGDTVAGYAIVSGARVDFLASK